MDNSPNDMLAQRMQRLSLIVSLTAAGLMLVGWSMLLIYQAPVIDAATYDHPLTQGWPRQLALTGIVALALLPAARVLLALTSYALKRRFIDAGVALVVLVELLIGMLSRGL